MKEAAARIKINKLLESAGWRFFANEYGPANIQLESSVALKKQDLDAMGENFEKAGKGYIDFLLLNEKSFPLIVLEAKAEKFDPLVGKEQARKYAKSKNCRFVILSNGNLHYFWDLERGNPYLITSFPTPASIAGYQKTTPDPKRLIEEVVGDDYVVLTQRPGYAAEAAWKNEAERAVFIVLNSLRFLRLYQLKAIYPDWPMEVFGEVTSTITPPAKIQAGDFSDVGRYPVIDQSQNAIAGRTDDKSMLVNGTGGLVIFGDHTCAVKFIDERFAQGADGIKIIKAGERLKPKFVYFYLLSRPIEQDGYKRHFGKLKESRIAVPPLATQQAIVAEIEAEQALVTANRELITRFEKKIQATLVRVWGEEAPAKKETDV